MQAPVASKHHRLDSITEIGDYYSRNKKKRFESVGGSETPDLTTSDGGEKSEEAEKARLLLLSVIETDTEVSPACLKLRSALINHVLEKDPKRLLQEAVDHCPLHVELWLGLARLEKLYDTAKEVLKKAREKLPRERALWIEEAKLEEAAANKGGNNNTKHMVGKVIKMGIMALFEQHVEFDRLGWIKDAEGAEQSGCVETCKAIIENTVGIGVKKEDRKVTWFGDAEECKNRGSIETARAIYMYALGSFGSSKKSIWLKAIQFEKAHGTRETVDELLCVAVRIPKGEVFWLMLANEKMIAGDVSEAREILKVAYSKCPDFEEIWNAAFKLEYENKELERARACLAKARNENEGGGRPERMWMKSAVVERELKNVAGERRLLDEGLGLFPWFFKLWLMLGQLEERLDRLHEARDAYKSGVKHCPNSIPIWLSLAKVEERISSSILVVTDVLKMGRKRNPKDPQLWLAGIRAEKSELVAVRLMEKALKECRGSKNSGILLAYSIEMSSTSEEWKTLVSKMKCEEEDEDPHVIAAIGNKLFSDDGNTQVDEARIWLNRAVSVAPDIGDFWAFLYKFELKHGSENNQKEVLRKCIAAQPKHGDRWQPISKAVENSHQPVEVILNKLVVALEKEEEKAAATRHNWL
ncbi:protein STABILIZED1-like [Rutidosis leptorrhynchoides]|uniref:protein STABILIZED1-like n=1 Tax=Rutidosis leptorrhynchoides TaxID=125765 RepID=UPI003A99781B